MSSPSETNGADKELDTLILDLYKELLPDLPFYPECTEESKVLSNFHDSLLQYMDRVLIDELDKVYKVVSYNESSVKGVMLHYYDRIKQLKTPEGREV